MPDNLIRSLDLYKDIYVAPNGVAFVKPHIRQGDILDLVVFFQYCELWIGIEITMKNCKIFP